MHPRASSEKVGLHISGLSKSSKTCTRPVSRHESELLPPISDVVDGMHIAISQSVDSVQISACQRRSVIKIMGTFNSGVDFNPSSAFKSTSLSQSYENQWSPVFNGHVLKRD